MPEVTYNERSWAIDLITEINIFLREKKRKVRSAGGENTVKSKNGRLFPDVLLFGDNAKGELLQGWELKFPDTPINNEEFINNASLKADLLNLDSFLLWNVREAILYRKDDGIFRPFKSWDPIPEINKREDVKQNDVTWKNRLQVIMEDLCEYFESGKLTEKTIVQSLSLNSIIDIILENIDRTSENIKSVTSQNARLDAEIDKWWRSSSSEYPDNHDKYAVLSRVVLTNWVIKIIFAHLLKRYFDNAKLINSLDEASSPCDGEIVMNKITKHCNFWNIFNANIGQRHVSNKGWNQLMQINVFLSKLDIENVDIKMLHEILQSSVVTAKRKGAGQYSTPKKLSELLARITIDNKTKIVMDPCCGTGTIIAEAYNLKKEYGISETDALNTIWASDKYAFPLQLATLTLTKPENIGQILHVFKQDIIQLSNGMDVSFKDPNDGKIIEKELPGFDYIISNLPFVQQEDMRVLNPDIYHINDWIVEKIGRSANIPGKSDLYAYIPFYLYQLVNASGKIGLVLSNAWLGTDYGKVFIDYLQHFFEFENVVISGRGRWFQNAKIVTTIITLKKKVEPNPSSNNGNISFCTLKQRINDIHNVKELADNIILKQTEQNIEVTEHSQEDIKMFEKIGLPWSSFFADMKSIIGISNKLITANKLLDINRGTRRGWNNLFYPEENHGIEEEFIKPVLKNFKDCKTLVAKPNKIAFCCPKSIAELEVGKSTGALKWIRKFEKQFNEKGQPLPKSLKRKGVYWYEMSPNTLADYVANVNFDKSLFIARLMKRSFVDQRLIRFTIKEEIKHNRILIHAILNSVISMFFIEALGFGRGEGALDLNATKLKNNFQILNPELLSEGEQKRVIEAFQPLVNRQRYALEVELKQEDRKRFEEILFKVYNIDRYLPIIQSELVKLQRIRLAATM